MPGYALGVEIPITFGNISGNAEFVSPTGAHFVPSFSRFSDGSSSDFGAELGAYSGSFWNVGNDDLSDFVFSGINNDFVIPISFSVSDLELQELLVDVDLNPRVMAFRLFIFTSGIVNSPAFFDYSNLQYRITGTWTVTFSDGTIVTQSFSNIQSSRLSFGVKKDNRTNMFDLTSDNAFNLTSKDIASLAGSLSHSGGLINAPVSGQVSGTAQLPDELKADIHAGGTASFSTRGYSSVIKSLYTPSGGQHFQTDNQIEIQQNSTGMPIGVRYFNIYASKLAISMLNGTLDVRDASIYFGVSQSISLTASLVDAKVDSLSVTSAKASAVGTLVSPNSSVDSVVQISRHEPFVTISSFSFSGHLILPRQKFERPLDMDNLSFSKESGTNMNASRFTNAVGFIIYPYVTYGDKEGVISHMASTLDGIYYALRYDLPLQLRHLIIPTEEEVKDVLEESFDNIAEEYPGAAGTITTIKGQFTDFNAAISGSSSRGLVLPGITVSIPGSDRKVKLWEDFDLLPYLQTGPARSLMYWVELMLKALIFIYLVRQAASMFISAVTGYSYLEWFGLSNKPFMGDDGLGEALPEGYLEREVG